MLLGLTQLLPRVHREFFEDCTFLTNEKIFIPGCFAWEVLAWDALLAVDAELDC